MNSKAAAVCYVDAVFFDERTAAGAVRRLVDAGFPDGQISALVKQGGRIRELHTHHKTGVPRGAIVGFVLGATLGVLGSAAGLLRIVPWLSALQVAVIGAIFGTFVGALGGLAHWKEEVDFPAESFDSGCVIVRLKTHYARAAEARHLLRSTRAAGTPAKPD